MADLITLLPQPRHESRAYVRKDVQPEAPAPVKATPEPPAYGQRDGWLPKTEEDFGDGGAFPEIHIFQYPLGMGRRDSNAVARASKALSLQVDAEGKPTFDLVVRQNVRKDQIVFSQYKDMVEKDATESQLARPSLEEEQKATERTKAALGQIVSAKLAAAQPTHVKGTKQDEPTFIRYTPTQQGDQYNSGAGQRIIQLREAPVDPLEPPRFTHKKTPAGPPSPPVPVLHSPPRKVTAADMQNWKIPPCISNWKNVKGYTIPLDKRLAADGRGLQDVTINDKFAKLAESLGVAERQARTEIEARAQLTRTVARKQKEQKEAELRNLAAQARAAGGHRGMAAPESAESSTTATTSTTGEINEDLDDEGEGQSSSSSSSRGGRSKETDDDLERRDQREEMRRDFKRELRRDLRMEKMSDEKKQNKTFAGRDKERDVSEKIALGQKTAAGKDTLFDQRLFNQQEGLSQGFGADDDYNQYDKPLFKGSSANFIYRPKPNSGELLGDEDQADRETASGGKVNKILEKSAGGERAPRAPDRGFRGTESAGPNASQRQKPVEFEKQTDDPFGLGDFLKDSKDGKKRKANALDGIGSKGHMMASAGGASFGSSDDSRHSKRMEFREAGSDDGDDRSSKRQRR